MKSQSLIVFLKVLFLFLTIGFAGNQLRAQQQAKRDSLLQSLDLNLEEDSVHVAILINLAESFKNENPEKSGIYLTEALNIAKNEGLSFQEAITQRLFVQYFSLNGQLENAIKSGLRAIRIFDSLGVKDQILVTQSMLIPIYNSEGYYDKALEMSLKSLEKVKDDPDTPSKGRYYFNAGNSYTHLEEYTKALEYYDIALTLSKKANFRPGIAVVSVNIAFCKMQIGSYEEARLILEPQLEYLKETNNLSVEAVALDHLGDIALKQLKNELALSYYEDSYSAYQKLGFKENLEDLSNKLFIQYSIVGEKEKANIFQDKYEHLRDSLRNEEITEIIGDLQTRYETTQKEAEIASLKQQSEIQNLQIRQRTQAIFIGILIFISILAILYFLNKQRNADKQKKQVELEQRFLRSQLNPHFISNALVAVQSSLLEKNTEDATNYLSAFSRLMREILENSRHEFITVEAELAMLKDYLEIHKRRLNHSFDYQIAVDENIDIEMDMIPPMLIQPFVENAIEHGLHPDREGRIWISVSRANEVLQVNVKDNGLGITEKSSNHSSHRSLSTAIIEERIQLFNHSLKDKIKLLIENWYDASGKVAGTLVELYVPLS